VPALEQPPLPALLDHLRMAAGDAAAGATPLLLLLLGGAPAPEGSGCCCCCWAAGGGEAGTNCCCCCWQQRSTLASDKTLVLTGYAITAAAIWESHQHQAAVVLV